MDYLAGVDVGERGAPSAVAEAVLHDGGAEQHEHRPAAEHPPPWIDAPVPLPSCSKSASILLISEHERCAPTYHERPPPPPSLTPSI